MTNSIDFRNKDCVVCFEPLISKDKAAYHATCINESGESCDGSLHPQCYQCAIDVIKGAARCSSCRIPLNKRSIGLRNEIDPNHLKKYEDLIFFGGIGLGVVGGIGTLIYSFYNDIPPATMISRYYVYSYSMCGIALATEKIYSTLIKKPKFREGLAWMLGDKGTGAKMIVVDMKPLLPDKSGSSSGNEL